MMRVLPVLLVLIQLAGCSEPEPPTINFYLAIQRGDINQIERHIYWKTDINQLDRDGRYPLQVAAGRGDIVTVKLLLKNGADINAVNPAGHSALDDAILSGRIQVADLLLKQSADLDPNRLLLMAAQSGNTDRDVVDYLVGKGADTEVRNQQGDTPLLIAIRQGNHRLARHLVRQGADVNVTDKDGRSALAVARALEEPDMVRMLLQNGAIMETPSR